MRSKSSVLVLMTAFCWASTAVAAPATTRPARATQGLRLHGTFIQYQPWMMKMTADAWQRELEAMHRAGLRTIVLQWLNHNGHSFIASEPGAVDPTELILSFADKHGMQVFLGLAMDDEWWKWTPQTGIGKQLSEWTKATTEQAWARYGKHASLAGWYIPPEPSDTLSPEFVPALKAFFRETSELCDRLSGNKPVAFAPFLTGQVEPKKFEKVYTNLLADSGIDIVMVQDGVGARAWDDAVHSSVVPLFRAMRDACLASGVDFWSDLEIFRNTNKNIEKPQFAPADIRRIQLQLAAEAPFVSRFIAFDFFHYMSPHRGERQRDFYEAYLREIVDRPFYPVYGTSVIIDPSFAYYHDRSPDSIAAEIRANGYSTVHYIAEPSSRVNPKLVEAFHRAGIGVWCQIFGNGTYSKSLFPPEWPQWAMVTRTHLKGGQITFFQHLCLNNPDYRAWKKKDLAKTLKIAPFDGIEIGEAFWPEYPGPESPAYGCFCKSCQKAFTKMYPEESALPDILDAESPRSPKKNPELWSKWLQFRQVSMTDFLNDLVNGSGGLRETSPNAAVCIWGLALSEPGGVKRIREDHGQDAGLTAAKVKPDVYCFQTHWPDWTRADLSPDYVKSYLPFIEQLRKHAPDLRLMIQADIGSTREAVRDRTWIDPFERACQQIGVESTCMYEYFIGGWTYREPPRAASATRAATGQVQLAFTRRIDPAAAKKVGAFEVDGKPAEVLKVDGNLVTLKVNQSAVKGGCSVTIRGLTDDAGRRLFRDYPANACEVQQIRISDAGK